MSGTTIDSSANVRARQSKMPSAALYLPKNSPLRQSSKALSISSLSTKNTDDKSFVAKELASAEACRDVERELAAIETRLSAFRGRRKRNDSESRHYDAVPRPLQDDNVSPSKEELASVSLSSSVSLNATMSSNLSKAQQEAGAVADQVASTLIKCDQLLQRVKSCDTSRVSSISSSRERNLQVRNKVGAMTSSARNFESALPDSNSSSISRDESDTLAIEDDETLLTQKAQAVKRLAVRCQRDIETSTTRLELHHQQMQATYMKELERKYDSKKHVTLMTLREQYEKETKALVRTKMEKYEFDEAVAVKKSRVALLEERNRALKELQSSHRAAMDESLSQLELHLTTDTERKKRELRSQLEDELNLRLRQMQEESCESMERWEVEQKQKLEKELYDHREAAVARVLKAQEERTAVLKQEIETLHFEKEKAELEKLNKALAFGAQAQLQQLRKKLEMEHDEKVDEIKAEASLSLERESEELKQMLTRSHREQQERLQSDLEKKKRIAIMNLHDTMQESHRKSLDTLKHAAEQRHIDALAANTQDFEQECRQEIQQLEQTLEQERSMKLRQLELDHAEECELKLEQLRLRAVNHHARELEAKRSRMIQCKNVLLAEASAFLSFENKIDESRASEKRVRSKGDVEDKSAAVHLVELKKHLSKELSQYVDVMVAEFDELAEEQRILVAKITESTQLYLFFKRQCGVLEAQSIDLSNGLERLHDQLEKKDDVCRKLYQANEALLQRLQVPTLETTRSTTKFESSSPVLTKS